MTYIDNLVKWFGPVGALAFILACLVGYFYRRDILALLDEVRRDREHLMEVVVANTESKVALAESLGRFGDALERHEEREERTVERIAERVEAGVRAALHPIPMRRT